MNIQKFVNPPQDASFHSNGFADAAGKSAGPGGAPQSFGQRAPVSRGGKTVRGYGHSMIGRGHMRDTARADLQKGNPLRQSGMRSPMGSGTVARPAVTPIVPRRTFNEPPRRGFTPFS